MKKITYIGPLPASPPVAVAPASELSLPKGKACEVDDDTAAKLIKALPGAFSVEGDTKPVVPATDQSAPVPAAKPDPAAPADKGGKP